jgi:Flp pilus assembly protein TadD
MQSSLTRPSSSHGLLLLLGLVTWSATLHRGFVNFDTPWMVIDNPVLAEGGLSAVRSVLWDMSFATRHALGAEYLPVRDLSVLLDLSLWPHNYLVHHLHNLALYLGLCALLLEVMSSLFGRGPRAWFAAALFAVHPAQVESVAWLVGRKDLLAVLFVLAAVLSWLRSGGRGRGLGIALICMLLACWSKNTAIVLPALLALLAVLHVGVQRDRTWWLGWLGFGGIGLLVVATSMAVGEEMGFLGERRGDGLLEVLIVQCRMTWHYLATFLWPSGLSVLYSEPVISPVGQAASLVSILACVLLTVAVVLCWRRRPLVSLGLLWFVVAQLPTSQLLPLQTLVSDRYLFLPSVGLAIAAGAALPAWQGRRRKALAVALSGVLVVLAVASWQRSGVWRDSVALWSDAVTREPGLGRNHAALAGALRAAGRAGEAATVLEKALTRLPSDPLVLQSRGMLLMDQGRTRDAEAALRGALRADPRLRRAANNLALLLHRSDRSSEALNLARQLARTHPYYPVGLNTLGAILLDLGQLDDARTALEASLDLDPRGASALCNLGSVSYRQGYLDEARRRWLRCQQSQPDHPVAAQGLEHIDARRP